MLNRGRLLVVDDCEIWRMLMRCSFSVDTWDVVEVETAEEAWQRFCSEHFDAVVSDVLLPGVNGFDLVREMRNRPAAAKLPIVLVSGRQSQQFIEEALRAGADRFLRKHHDTRSLVSCIHRLAGGVPNPAWMTLRSDRPAGLPTIQ